MPIAARRARPPVPEAPLEDIGLEEEIMRGSPFAIPPSREEPGTALAAAAAPGEMRRFLLALFYGMAAMAGLAAMLTGG